MSFPRSHHPPRRCNRRIRRRIIIPIPPPVDIFLAICFQCCEAPRWPWGWDKDHLFIKSDLLLNYRNNIPQLGTIQGFIWLLFTFYLPFISRLSCLIYLLPGSQREHRIFNIRPPEDSLCARRFWWAAIKQFILTFFKLLSKNLFEGPARWER